jgi:hypothetical protein
MNRILKTSLHPSKGLKKKRNETRHPEHEKRRKERNNVIRTFFGRLTTDSLISASDIQRRWIN